jgi:hypothetical protein
MTPRRRPHRALEGDYIGAPVHSVWFFRKWLRRVAAAAEPHPDFLRPLEAPDKRIFLLALVSQPVAISAREQFPSAVQDRNPPPAVSAIRTHRTNEPRASATKIAIGPCDRHTLLDGFPLGGQQAAHSIDQHSGIRFRPHLNGAGRFSAARPRPREGLAEGKATPAMPMADVWSPRVSPRQFGLNAGARRARVVASNPAPRRNKSVS